jgi:hypothetical protein
MRAGTADEADSPQPTRASALSEPALLTRPGQVLSVDLIGLLDLTSSELGFVLRLWPKRDGSMG